MAKPTWPFDSDPSEAVITVRQIVEDGEPILYVTRDEEDWQFLTGGEVTEEDALLVSLEEIVEIDGTVTALADLRPGWRATRERLGGVWTRTQSPPEE